jgi:hypothetical protein
MTKSILRIKPVSGESTSCKHKGKEFRIHNKTDPQNINC